MALTLTTQKTLRGVNFTLVIFRLVASGNYAVGGEVPTPTIQSLNRFNGRPVARCTISGRAGFVYSYNESNGKVQVWCNTAGGVNGGLGEHTAVAYVAGVTGDMILGWVVFAN